MKIIDIPYLLIKSETIISFSGGRTSAMMLKLILDAHGGTLPPWVKVIFCNTGKEREETLRFVRDCAIAWNIEIIWLEYWAAPKAKDRWKVVNFETASRNGEPFEALIRSKGMLPNPTKRYCTIELKIRCAKRYAQVELGWKHWDVAIGFRADEPSRVAGLSRPNKEPFDRYAPLAKIGVTADQVGKFWREQEFDLQLPNMNGKTMHGNCDLCFLKGQQTLLRLIAERPEIANWWKRMEVVVKDSGLATGDAADRFHKDRPSYARQQEIAVNQHDFLGFDNTSIDCMGCPD
jgi:3'-phosphoadenosine 5'-phosphosulfate sulfotransferase (PAPS reductase)/FAD synthetase